MSTWNIIFIEAAKAKFEELSNFRQTESIFNIRQTNPQLQQFNQNKIHTFSICKLLLSDDLQKKE